VAAKVDGLCMQAHGEPKANRAGFRTGGSPSFSRQAVAARLRVQGND